MCGENIGPYIGNGPFTPQPPRVRGKLATLKDNAHEHPSIPACAGKTESVPAQSGPLPLNPRVCGETGRPGPRLQALIPQSPRVRGNPGAAGADCHQPPRVRGKRSRARESMIGLSSIPACAGKTGHLGAGGASISFNPRVCAGKTLRAGSFTRFTSFNPRVCGENHIKSVTRDASIPQPPRVRGKLCPLSRSATEGPSTPACAGKTARVAGKALTITLNPRVCGENLMSWRAPWRQKPQPPRVRGKPELGWLRLIKHSSTPACAGKTWPGARRRAASSLNPRVCGENQLRYWRRDLLIPQPPRVRGKLLPTSRLRPTKPSTPACAGKTLQLKTLNLLMKHSKCSPSVQAKSIHLHQPGDDR